MSQFWCELGVIAKVGLGYKSLQNTFFYVSKDAADSYGIEDQFLETIFKMKNISGKRFFQKDLTGSLLFYCPLSEKDLKGTKALQYIRSMADRPAARKKQSSGAKSIEDVLSQQGGGYWYAPKAKLHKAHIWLRKAFDDNYSPFIFNKAVAFDQRANYVIPKKGIDWKHIAALLTSTLFGLAIESEGSASMGAGALEIKTKRLPKIRVFDIRQLGEAEQLTLETLATKVWENEVPLNWKKSDTPGKHMQALDQFLLKKMGNPVTIEKIYYDLAETCRSRSSVANNKTKTQVKKVTEDVDEVAGAIAESVFPFLNSRRFPEAFLPPNTSSVRIELPQEGMLKISCHPMLAVADLLVADDTGKLLLEQRYGICTAQVFVKAILLGRRDFLLPTDDQVAGKVMKEFDAWFPTVLKLIDERCKQSAVGTKYEEPLYKAVLNKLKLHPDTAKTAVYGDLIAS